MVRSYIGNPRVYGISKLVRATILNFLLRIEFITLPIVCETSFLPFAKERKG